MNIWVLPDELKRYPESGPHSAIASKLLEHYRPLVESQIYTSDGEFKGRLNVRKDIRKAFPDIRGVSEEKRQFFHKFLDRKESS